MRPARACRYIPSRGVSPETPSAPCTWIARSITSIQVRDPPNLPSDISPVPRLSERVRRRHAAVRVADLAVVARRLPHHRHRPHDLEPRRIGGDDDLAHAPVGGALRVRHAHDDGEGRAERAAGEPLVPVDHPVVAVPHGGRAERRRVGAGHLRFRHREAGAELAVDQRLQPALLLLQRAELPENLRVAGVRRLRPEGAGREEAATQNLVDVDVGHEADPHPARLRGQVRRPHPHRLRPRLQVLHQRLALAAFEQQLLVRIDVLVHERLHALAHLAYLGCESEVRHSSSFGPPCYGAVSSRNAARLILARSAASRETGTMFTIGRVTPFRRYASIFSRTRFRSPNPRTSSTTWSGTSLSASWRSPACQASVIGLSASPRPSQLWKAEETGVVREAGIMNPARPQADC